METMIEAKICHLLIEHQSKNYPALNAINLSVRKENLLG